MVRQVDAEFDAEFSVEFDLFDAEFSPKRYWRGARYEERAEERDYA